MLIHSRTKLTRLAGLSVALLPLGAVLSGGCDSPTQFDDFCGFLRDPENCFREFFIDVGARCGVGEGVQTGEFLARDKLDLCVLSQGGQVVFDPAIDLAKPPPNNEAPLKVKIINVDATECGVVEFRAKYDFSVTINAAPLPPNTDPADLPEEYVVGGTFDVEGGKASDTLNVTCPSTNPDLFVGATESYTFNRLQLADCEELQPVAPQAELEFNPGGVDVNGVIRLFVFYPPIDGSLENASPVPINYYECVIPAAPPPCLNGIKDGAETDIDCGGSFCEARCFESQGCITNSDCANDQCVLVNGLKQCISGL
jgi:hypothetical protein